MLTKAELLSRYGGELNHCLISGNSFVVFNEKNRDLVIRGRCRSTGPASLYQGETKTTVTVQDCNQLLSRIDELTITRASCSFTLSPLVIQKLKQAIKKLNATHLRFYNEQDKLKIVVFDYVKFHSEYRLPRKSTQKIHYYETRVLMTSDFTVTLLASSFEKLPTEYLNVRIGENGVVQVSKEKDDTRYLLRDQELIEPMTTFFSPRLSREIAFVLEPTMA
jgi:hypothetical protein